MDTKDKFEIIRQATRAHSDKEGIPVVLALVDIAVAAERHLELAERNQP